MAFLRASISSDNPTSLQGEGVLLRSPQMSDYAAWAELRAQSRAHLTPWEPSWPRDDLSRSAFRRRLRHYHREAREDAGYAFFIFDSKKDQLVGGLAFSNIRRGVTQSAALGYWVGLPFANQGYMTRAARAALSHAFGALRLHRVEAAVQPANTSSIQLLERVGFEKEGLARRYLKINGVWQDHFLFGLLGEEWMKREVRPA